MKNYNCHNNVAVVVVISANIFQKMLGMLQSWHSWLDKIRGSFVYIYPTVVETDNAICTIVDRLVFVEFCTLSGYVSESKLRKIGAIMLTSWYKGYINNEFVSLIWNVAASLFLRVCE